MAEKTRPLKPGDRVTVDSGTSATVVHCYASRGFVRVLMDAPWSAYLTLTIDRLEELLHGQNER